MWRIGLTQKMREVYHSEPNMSTGTPILDIMEKRLSSMVQMAESSLKWVETHQAKMDAQVAREDQEKKDAANIAKAIKESLDMQEQVRLKTNLVVNQDTWDAKWGCPKCSLGKERQHVLQSQQKDSKAGCRDAICGEAWHCSER